MLDWKHFETQFPMVMNALKHAKLSGRLAHAYLVVTSNPDYRLAFPGVLSLLTACTTPEPDGSPCMKCDTCRQLKNGIYPDTYTLAPTSKAREIVIGKDSDDIDTLRWFEALFHLSSITESGWKIGVVQEADTMNESAQNAFLKTLEEPPGRCLFILTTGRVSHLLPTIRSRCQLLALTDNKCEYKFPRSADLPAILAGLFNNPERSIMKAEDSARALIDIADSLYDAAKKEVEERWAARVEAAKNLENAGVKLIEKRIEGETSSEYRRYREQFISMIHTWFAQLALLASGLGAEMLPNPEILDPASLQNKPEEEKAYKALSFAEDLLKAMRTNVNDELALRTFCLKVTSKA
ncbi:MAG TPA: hypothetical protein DE060_10200 [Lentisphaeria bacterium]|nr:hypothetical protein [Lentisphaeria bacterium]HCG49558.1 hypothetical protein [Lentisphaeria bacterium]